jgi:hypothetical protein
MSTHPHIELDSFHSLSLSLAIACERLSKTYCTVVLSPIIAQDCDLYSSDPHAMNVYATSPLTMGTCSSLSPSLKV